VEDDGVAVVLGASGGGEGQAAGSDDGGERRPDEVAS
jgi:hypothetical protein